MSSPGIHTGYTLSLAIERLLQPHINRYSYQVPLLMVISGYMLNGFEF